MLNGEGSSVQGSNTDADVDGQDDADDVGDTDDGGEIDADPDTDPETDPETDVVEEFRIVSVTPASGYTCGYLHDPRGQEIRIRYQGVLPGSSVTVSFGDQELSTNCNNEQAHQGCVSLEDRNAKEIRVHYPSSPLVQSVDVSIYSGDQEVTWSGQFEYQLTPISFTPHSVDNDIDGAVHAMSAGCFRDPITVGDHCSHGGFDVAIAPNTSSGDGALGLVFAPDNGVQAAQISDFSGPYAHQATYMTEIYIAGLSPSSSPPDMVTYNRSSKTLRIHRYDRTDQEFTNLHRSCSGLSTQMAGLNAGEFHSSRGGQELVMLVWPATSAGTPQLTVSTRATDASTCPGLVGSETIRVTPPPNDDPRDLRSAVADFFGDGTDDIAIATLDNMAEPTLFILNGDGSGGFSEVVSYELSDDCTRPVQALATQLIVEGTNGVTDLRNMPDIVVGCQGSSSVELLINRDGAFDEAVTLETELDDTSHIVQGFLDQDPIPDFVIFSPGTDGYVVLQGTGAIDEGEEPWQKIAGAANIRLEALSSVAIADLEGPAAGGSALYHYGDIIFSGESSEGNGISMLWANN